MRRYLFAVVLLATLGSGCAVVPRRDYSAFFEHHPRSILVVPARNDTTAVDAPDILNTTITRSLAERGYYVFPVYLTQDILRDLGLTNEGLVHTLSPQRYREIFGADAVLFVTITDWTTKYLFIASTVTVKLHYKLVDTHTGLVIWEGIRQAQRQSGGRSICTAPGLMDTGLMVTGWRAG